MTRMKKNGLSILSTAVLAVVLSSLSPVRTFAEEAEAHKGTLQNWELYGSVRLQAASWKRYKWYKKDSVGSELVDTLPSTRFQMGLQNNSYFGVRGKGEKFGFGFEMGLSQFLEDVGLDGQGSGQLSELGLSQRKRQSTVLRKIYGDWFISEMATLRIGQDWNLANFFISNQVFNSDAGLGYSGVLYTGRRPQLKLTVAGKSGEALTWKGQTALIKQDLYTLPSNFGVSGYLGTTEEKFPKLELAAEVGYEFSKLFGVAAKGVGGMAQYDAVIYKEEDLSLNKDRRATIKSNLMGGNLDVRVWKVKASVCYAKGQNLGSYGVWLGNPDAPITDLSMVMFYPSTYAILDTATVPTGDYGINNAKTWQFGTVVNAQVLPWLAIEGGYGKVQADHEDTASIMSLDYGPQRLNGVLNAMERSAYYVNLQFTVAGGHMHIVPEYSYSDLGGFQKNKSSEAGGRWHSIALKIELDI